MGGGSVTFKSQISGIFYLHNVEMIVHLKKKFIGTIIYYQTFYSDAT